MKKRKTEISQPEPERYLFAVGSELDILYVCCCLCVIIVVLFVLCVFMFVMFRLVVAFTIEKNTHINTYQSINTQRKTLIV